MFCIENDVRFIYFCNNSLSIDNDRSLILFEKIVNPKKINNSISVSSIINKIHNSSYSL